MLIVVADDHEINRKLLNALLKAEGYEIREAHNGSEALALLQEATVPVVGLIDWEMPEIEGPEVCRQIRLKTGGPPMFLILLTVRDRRHEIVLGLESGAHDYITKPFDRAELLARVKIGVQMVELQAALLARVAELNKALKDIQTLGGLLPICSYCKKIRNDQNYWEQVESYIAKHARVQFSHGLCPTCFQTQMAALKQMEGKKVLPP
jgi:sigma-B regulation protein RsbU (phosphoserine phosphatase)